MDDKKLKITRKLDDNYKVFSIRLKTETIDELDRISNETNRSRNELINIMLEFGIENIELN